jgi:hypothetical protein
MTYDISGVHALNKFSQAKLIEAGLIDVDDYNGAPIFIPAQEQPELTNLPSDIPFIVYNYSTSSEYEQWWVQHEQIAYVIYCDREDKIRRISHYLDQLYRRYDWSAQEVNDYLTANGTDAQKAFNFKYMRSMNLSSIEPATEEGGRYGATFVFATCFTADLDQTGMRE